MFKKPERSITPTAETSLNKQRLDPAFVRFSRILREAFDVYANETDYVRKDLGRRRDALPYRRNIFRGFLMGYTELPKARAWIAAHPWNERPYQKGLGHWQPPDGTVRSPGNYFALYHGVEGEVNGSFSPKEKDMLTRGANAMLAYDRLGRKIGFARITRNMENAIIQWAFISALDTNPKEIYHKARKGERVELFAHPIRDRAHQLASAVKKLFTREKEPPAALPEPENKALLPADEQNPANDAFANEQVQRVIARRAQSGEKRL